MIEQIMYFALGALVATFVALLVLPAVWHRAVRLTTRRVEAAVPISIFEIQADKDQQRAFFALNQRRLELQGDAMRETIAAHAATIEHQRQKIVELEAALAELTGRHKLLEATHAEQSVLVGELQDQLADQQARAAAIDAASVTPAAEGSPLSAVAPVESPAAAEGPDLQEAALALSVAPLRAEQEQLKAAILATQHGAAVPPGKLKSDLMNVAAQLTAMVARMEGESSPIPGLVAARADDEATNSLAARIRTLLATPATEEASAPGTIEAPRPLAHAASA